MTSELPWPRMLEASRRSDGSRGPRISMPCLARFSCVQSWMLYRPGMAAAASMTQARTRLRMKRLGRLLAKFSTTRRAIEIDPAKALPSSFASYLFERLRF